MSKHIHNRNGAPAALAVILSNLVGCHPPAGTHTWSPAPEPLIRRVAERVLQDFPQPPPFDWGEGVLMTGMMRAGLTLDEPRYMHFVQRWADHWRERGIADLMAKKGYCGHWGPGLPVVMLYDQTRDSSYLAMAQQIVDFIQTKATRTRDGFPGTETGQRQIWVDTLFMCCPLYTRMARTDSRPALITEAAKLLEVCASHCQDEKTGLFWHMYDEPSNSRVGVLWARGNGWTSMSYVEVLQHLDRRSPEFTELSGQFGRLVKGLIATRDRSTGLWHTILDGPDTYLETSAAAMYLCSLAQAERMGLIRLEDPGIMERAWAGLARKVDNQGRVFDVSGGTNAVRRPEVYANKPRGTYTWGTGAFLLAATETARTKVSDRQ